MVISAIAGRGAISTGRMFVLSTALSPASAGRSRQRTGSSKRTACHLIVMSGTIRIELFRCSERLRFSTGMLGNNGTTCGPAGFTGRYRRTTAENSNRRVPSSRIPRCLQPAARLQRLGCTPALPEGAPYPRNRGAGHGSLRRWT